MPGTSSGAARRLANRHSMEISSREIREGLEGLGLGRGMRLMVHSSLSAFGWVEEGAEGVIKALMDLVGPEGTILMPTFNHMEIFEEGRAGYFDPLETPTIDGRIPDTFWRMPGVHRSLNPSHAFAAWGWDAERYTRDHHLTLTVGEGSPIGLLMRDGGYQLNLGTTHHTTTAKHLAEMIHRSPCLGYRTEAYPVRLPGGRMVEHRTWGWRERDCPITESGEFIEREMNRHGLQQKGFVGPCPATWCKVEDLANLVLEMLKKGYAGFPPCSRCPIRPRKTAATRPSDWDEAVMGDA